MLLFYLGNSFCYHQYQSKVLPIKSGKWHQNIIGCI